MPLLSAATGALCGLCTGGARGPKGGEGGNARDVTEGGRRSEMPVRFVSPPFTSCTCNSPPATAVSSATAVDVARDSPSNETVKSTFTEAACTSNALRRAGVSFVTDINSTLLGATPPSTATPFTKARRAEPLKVLVV